MRCLMVALSCALFSMTAFAQQRGRNRPSGGPPPPAQTAGAPLTGLSASQVAAFMDGRGEFTDVETIADGLGPVFNERSCVACHSVPAVGGGSTRMVTRFARRVGGVFDPLTAAGGSLMQDHAIGAADGSPVSQSMTALTAPCICINGVSVLRPPTSRMWV